ncbi:MAG: zinc ABC transporter substrate-binding protein [Nitrososphaerales archaeon]
MRRYIIAVMLVLVLVVGSAFALVLFNREAPSQTPKRIKVATTLTPYREFIEKVGGEYVNVVVLVPPNAEPHTFDLTPSAIKAVSDAQIYFKVGSPLEFEVNWLNKLVELNPNMVVVDTSVGIEPIGEDDHIDPHVWLSPRNTVLIVEAIYQGLVKIDPENLKVYRQNKDSYISELKALDEEVNKILSDLKTRKFVVYHSAWAYFARDYNLVQIALEEEGKEPTIEEVAEVIKSAKSEGIKAIFAEPQFDPRGMDVIAEELGIKVVLIDTHSFTDYVNHIKGFALALKEALS